MLYTKKSRSRKYTNYLSFVDNEPYIIEKDKYRKLSPKEVKHIFNYCFHEVDTNKFVYEDIENMPVQIIIQFRKKTEKLISKGITKKYKKELIREFRNSYLMKLSSYLLKTMKGYSFDEINDIVFKDLEERKYSVKGKEYFLFEGMDIEKIKKETYRDLIALIDWYGELNLGRNIKLKVKKGKITFKKLKKTYKKEEEETKEFFCKI